VAGLYSAVALIYGSYTYARAIGQAVPVAWLAVYCLIVTIPYLLFFAVSRVAVVAGARISVVVLAVLGVLCAAILYLPSFNPTDGEYGVVYVLVPIVQVLLVGVAFAVLLVLQRRPSKELSNSTPHTDARANSVPHQSPSARAGERGR
jgi:hypothetical protein